MHIHASPAARVGIFVDAQNIFRSLRHLRNPIKIDYQKILNYCLAGRTLYCARFYDVVTVNNPSKAIFLDMIGCYYDVLTKPVQFFSDGGTKGDWDIGMAVDMISIADKLDVVILISGDGDFVPVVKYLKDRSHCRVEGVSILRTTSNLLLQELDSHFDLSEAAALNLCRN